MQAVLNPPGFFLSDPDPEEWPEDDEAEFDED
jgi:hypothetical protein